MEKVARILGKMGDAGMFAAEKKLIAQEVVANLYDAQHKTFGSQTSDAMALDFGLVPGGDEKAVADAMVRNMNDKYKGFMHGGIFGITRIGSMLARHGNREAALNMYTRKGEESFEWMWKSADATSLWEILPVNAKSEKAAYQVSHSHPMQAGYDVSFYEDIAGIRPDESGYGFKVIRFEPLFVASLQWAKASIESPYGTVSSSWKNETGKFIWQITIPANSTGLVALPDDKNISVNGKPLTFNKYQSADGNYGTTLYSFPSGSFNIQTW
jgi:alpha-L-rhamnosidase